MPLCPQRGSGAVFKLGEVVMILDLHRQGLTVSAIAQLDFVDRNEVIHFLGPPGTGKSHLATALGVEAVKAGRSVYFASLADIISALAKAEREGQLRDRIRFLGRTSLLIVDEIGYLPVIRKHRCQATAFSGSGLT